MNAITANTASTVLTGARQFVLFPLGKKRFALEAELVAELARPDRLQTFPHTTPIVTGVLVRRGHVIPVYDITELLVGRNAPARKFYLIIKRRIGQSIEWTALPVTGECELSAAVMLQPTGRLPGHVAGLLSLQDEIVEVIDLERIISGEASA